MSWSSALQNTCNCAWVTPRDQTFEHERQHKSSVCVAWIKSARLYESSHLANQWQALFWTPALNYTIAMPWVPLSGHSFSFCWEANLHTQAEDHITFAMASRMQIISTSLSKAEWFQTVLRPAFYIPIFQVVYTELDWLLAHRSRLKNLVASDDLWKAMQWWILWLWWVFVC